MPNKIVAFRDEEGNRVQYQIRDQLLVNRHEYLLMSPTNDESAISVYKLSFNQGQEELELIENDTEINMVKSVSQKI